MLGKLIKYEMKSQGFMYAGIYIVVMILSIVTFGAYKINTAMGAILCFQQFTDLLLQELLLHLLCCLLLHL